MKREILFRGKRTDDKWWVEGFYYEHEPPLVGIAPPDYVKPDNTAFIASTGFADWGMTRPIQLCKVIPETVGQFTGLTDKNGKKIFEGDIVRGRHWTSRNNKNPEDFHLWRVDWNEKSGLIIFKDSPTSDATLSIHDFADFEEVEVIGNIYDNRELLERR